jgi:quercetin dioxygenase-like cupin family protein
MDGSPFLSVAQAIAAYLAQTSAPTADVETEFRHMRTCAAAAVARPNFDPGPIRDRAALLSAAIAAAGDNTIAASLATLPAQLPWHYHYAARANEPDLANRIAFAELIGPAAPLTAPACRIGFTLMAPDTFYPLHAHPAIELYLVISGHARWTTPDTDRIAPPGDFVLHRSNEPHAMRSFAAPLLALYGWRGDIDTAAFYL